MAKNFQKWINSWFPGFGIDPTLIERCAFVRSRRHSLGRRQFAAIRRSASLKSSVVRPPFPGPQLLFPKKRRLAQKTGKEKEREWKRERERKVKLSDLWMAARISGLPTAEGFNLRVSIRPSCNDKTKAEESWQAWRNCVWGWQSFSTSLPFRLQGPTHWRTWVHVKAQKTCSDQWKVMNSTF